MKLSRTHEESWRDASVTMSQKQAEYIARQNGFDFDDHYDYAFGRAEQAIADEWDKNEHD